MIVNPKKEMRKMRRSVTGLVVACLVAGAFMSSVKATNNVISGSTERTCASSSALAVDGAFDTRVFSIDRSQPGDLETFDSRSTTWDDFILLEFSSSPLVGLSVFLR